MNLAEKRKNILINFAFYTFLIAAYYFFVKYAAALISPFLVAFAIALMLQKPVRIISKKTKIKKKFIAAVSVFLILAILAGIVALVGYKIATEFKGLGQYLYDQLNDLPALITSVESWIVNKLSALPESVKDTATDAVNSFADKLLSYFGEKEAIDPQNLTQQPSNIDLSFISGPLGSIISTVTQIPAILTATLISIIACFFLTCDYDNFTKAIKDTLPEKSVDKLVRTKKLFGDILGKMFKSYATIILITFCEVAVGLNLLKLIGVYEGGYIIAISLLIAIVDIFPVLGTGTILWPWAAISFIMGDIGMGIGLIVIYAVISVLRQIIEPKLVSMNIGIHPIFTLMGMYLGAQLFGVLGIFILPITMFLVKALNDEGIIHLWGVKKSEKKGS